MSLRTALVNMPFGFHIYPSIQLGTLATLLKTHGWAVDCHYLNLHFAHQIDLPVYNQLCEKRFLIGEWLFSHLLSGESPQNREYPSHFRNHLREVCRSIDRPESFLLDVKHKMAPEFLHWAAKSIPWGQYDVVGFTSTFNQNLASVTLARLIKEAHPSTRILFGGSNFESEMGMEYFRVYDWIDYVVPGEAEPVLPALMEALQQGGTIPPGVIHRRDGEIFFEENHSTFIDFQKYPAPDYTDYFTQLRAIDPRSPLLENPIILYETARGCWWGEKHHCTFCGLNASTMKFRARPAAQVQRDIAELSARYDTFRFRIVDNILEMKFLEDVFRPFSEQNLDWQFFLEIKSNLNKKQIQQLATGGVNVIQPGIESFSLNQLHEMDKGVRPMQNIFCLKWALYYGIEVSWNILTGFPGETDDDFRGQIELIRKLIHLQPPIAVGTLWLERFSPYFTRPGQYGIDIKGPGEAYSFVYDGRVLDLMKIAYDFEFETPERSVNPKCEEELSQVVEYWRQRHQSDNLPFLIFTKSRDFVTVYDGRDAGGSSKRRFDTVAGCIIAYCNEQPRTLEQIHSHAAEAGYENEIPQIGSHLEELEQLGILYGEKGKYLTLALPNNSHY